MEIVLKIKQVCPGKNTQAKNDNVTNIEHYVELYQVKLQW